MRIGDRSHVAGVEGADAAIGKRPTQEYMDALDDCGTAAAGEQQRGRDDCAKILKTQRPATRCLEVERQFVDAARDAGSSWQRHGRVTTLTAPEIHECLRGVVPTPCRGEARNTIREPSYVARRAQSIAISN